MRLTYAGNSDTRYEYYKCCNKNDQVFTLVKKDHISNSSNGQSWLKEHYAEVRTSDDKITLPEYRLYILIEV